MIGRRTGAHSTNPIHASRFVPVPPGDPLRAGMRALVDWLHQDHAGDIDPIIAAGMAHYQSKRFTPSGTATVAWGGFSSCLPS